MRYGEADFLIQPSLVEGAGMGLFAKSMLRPGDIIGDYTGDVLTDEEAHSEEHVDSLYLVQVCKDYWVKGEGAKANYTRYVNHGGRYSNARLSVSTRWKTVRIVAEATIRAGEEIYMDYGEAYWAEVGFDPVEPSLSKLASSCL